MWRSVERQESKKIQMQELTSELVSVRAHFCWELWEAWIPDNTVHLKKWRWLLKGCLQGNIYITLNTTPSSAVLFSGHISEKTLRVKAERHIMCLWEDTAIQREVWAHKVPRNAMVPKITGGQENVTRVTKDSHCYDKLFTNHWLSTNLVVNFS